MVVWLKQVKIDIWKFSPQNHISFYKVFFDKKHSKPPSPPLQANICDSNSLRPTRHSFLFWSDPFPNLGLKVVPPAEREGGGPDTVKPFKVIASISLEGLLLKTSTHTEANKNKKTKKQNTNMKKKITIRISKYETMTILSFNYDKFYS